MKTKLGEGFDVIFIIDFMGSLVTLVMGLIILEIYRFFASNLASDEPILLDDHLGDGFISLNGNSQSKPGS